MNLIHLVRREMFERKSQLATSLVAVVLGITVVVAIRNTSYYSEKAVARELDALGANILILPKSASVQNYFGADLSGGEIPESYVTTLAVSSLEGLDNLSPKLNVRVPLHGRDCVLTGILPRDEFRAKMSWRGAGIFAKPAKGCGTIETGREADPRTRTRRRVIETLAPNQALVGSDIAAREKLGKGGRLELAGRTFEVAAVLPQTGTLDDDRVFAHLHTVQEMAGKPAKLSAIEVVGCCNEISQGLVERINGLLPDARVVTVEQTVRTQIGTNRMMARLSTVFLAIILLVGGASIANYMFANVHERRREIGTLVAVGAQSSLVVRLFLLKALLLGLAGGLGGYALGEILAVFLGPRFAGVPVLPMWELLPMALGLALAMSLLASWIPARRAARLDPFATLREL